MKIIFLGDSTMQLNDASTFPQYGWPQALDGRFIDSVEVINLAKNGRSTKSYINEGLFDEALKVMDQDSYVVIEFGHNDEHTYNEEQYTRPYVEYKQNLIYMHDECVAKGAKVLLLTPIYRRQFLENGLIDPYCHKDYREAMIEVSRETNTPLIDMTTLTKEAITSMGDEASKKCYMNFPAGMYETYPEGKEDNTHLRKLGANLIASIFITEVIKMNHPICDLLK